MNNQTNQEQKKDKAAATGNNPEVIKLDFNQLKDGLSGFVRGTVEEALNGLLQAEAEDLCSAKRWSNIITQATTGSQKSTKKPVTFRTPA
jgi:hypothetical protein